jgi:NitT/TauT family transport system substrate-binding protein
MCDRHGIWIRPDEAAATASRRSFLKATSAAALTMAVMPGLLGATPARAAGDVIKGTHGAGFCNMNFFMAHATNLAHDEGLDIDFVEAPSFSDQVTFLGTGQVDCGVMPYTSFVALYDAGAPVKIIGGGGVQGCILLAQPGLDSPEKLKGKTLGTFQLDTLEVLPYDWLKKHNVAFKDINVRYMGSMPEAVEAFRAGALDMFSAIEPYGTTLLADVPGSIRLSDGTDIYGPNYTDCVLAVRSDLIEKNPGELKKLIKAMMKAQSMAETDPEGTLKKMVGPYYKTTMESARLAMKAQPSVIDARSQTQFILDRTDSIMEMGYIKKKPGRDSIDWSLLEQVIAENKDLYNSLKIKSV